MLLGEFLRGSSGAPGTVQGPSLPSSPTPGATHPQFPSTLSFPGRTRSGPTRGVPGRPVRRQVDTPGTRSRASVPTIVGGRSTLYPPNPSEPLLPCPPPSPSRAPHSPYESLKTCRISWYGWCAHGMGHDDISTFGFPLYTLSVESVTFILCDRRRSSWGPKEGQTPSGRTLRLRGPDSVRVAETKGIAEEVRPFSRKRDPLTGVLSPKDTPSSLFVKSSSSVRVCLRASGRRHDRDRSSPQRTVRRTIKAPDKENVFDTRTLLGRYLTLSYSRPSVGPEWRRATGPTVRPGPSVTRDSGVGRRGTPRGPVTRGESHGRSLGGHLSYVGVQGRGRSVCRVRPPLRSTPERELPRP